MENRTVAIIGTGLIGGSMAIAIRNRGWASRIIGVEASEVHAKEALRRGLVDEIADLEKAMAGAQLVILAIPVDAVETLLPQVLDRVDKQVVMDVGSIKEAVWDAIASHPKRNRFVATHPMWGTEYSGPSAAVSGAFSGKATVICNRNEAAPDARALVEELYRVLDMHLLYMDAAEHDRHVAYVSHISHVTSFALANTVLEKEKQESAIFELASGGFESTVRLAKSNASMWVPVLMQNRENVLDVLDEHLHQLQAFRHCLLHRDAEGLKTLISQANEIRKIIQ